MNELVKTNGDEIPTAVTVPTLFGTESPRAILTKAADYASALADVIKDKRLFVEVHGRKHVLVEGWTLLGSMLGVFPVTVWTRPIDGGGWEARVEARTLSGQIVGAAEAQCTRQEKMWSFEPKNKWGKALDPRDDFALRSMAQTRAVSKALRLPLGFIIQLAGYDATPAEEMAQDDGQALWPDQVEPAKVEYPKALTKAEVAAKKERGELKGQRQWHQPIPESVITDVITEPVDEEPPAIISEPDPKAGAAWLEHKKAMTAEIDRGDFQAKLEAVTQEVSAKIEKERATDSTSMFHGTCDHPGCSAVLVTGVSESEKDKGREYWICHWAAQEKARMKKEGFSDKAIALAIKDHTRMWKKK